MEADLHAALSRDGLAHDLSNLLQTILQAAALISSDEEHRDVADVIARSVGRAERILGLHDSDEPAPLRAVVDSAAELVREGACMRPGADLSILFLGADARIRIRQSALERALVNLFANSWDAALAAGRESVRVTLDGEFVAGGYRLTVSDDGPGIPTAMMGQIFTPRVSGQPGGEGLGLYITRAALAECGATITASNGEAGGAVFTLLFPAAALVLAAAASGGVKI